MILKVQQTAQEIGMKMNNVENMSKSKQKKQMKEKIGNSVEERTKQKLVNKTSGQQQRISRREKSNYWNVIMTH